ncbi:hypothetical protein, partial [Acinetobacter baumannii]|uniref:hypothetical protein n=1 Tax=Acinetobacter baumannii TaxID=470 RepID=UPI00114741CC
MDKKQPNQEQAAQQAHKECHPGTFQAPIENWRWGCTKVMKPYTPRLEFEDKREARLLAIFNMMLAYVLALMHT